MAPSITTTYLVNGSKCFSARVDIVGDGTGELTGATVIDVANLTGTPSKFKIKKIVWHFNAFSAQLLWDADADVQAYELNASVDGHVDFMKTGAPLVNNAGTGVTGKLLLTTTSLASTKGSILIEGYH